MAKKTRDMTSYEIGHALDSMGITSPDFPNTDQTISVMCLQDAADSLGVELDVLETVGTLEPDTYRLGGYYGFIPTPAGELWFMMMDLEERRERKTNCSYRYSLSGPSGTELTVAYG